MDWKTRLKKVTLPHVNNKPQQRKLIFVQTPFSHSTSKVTYISLKQIASQ